MKLRVALATCLELPEPDVDEPLLNEALRAAGVEPTVAAWDDGAVDWQQFDLVVIRSTWDYHHRPEEFLGWCERVSYQSQLHNGIDVVRWNSHKGYLRDLEAEGVPITPTVWTDKDASTSLTELVAGTGWQQVVVKPAMSAGSWGTIRVQADDLEAGEAHLQSLLTQRDVMVQQYLPSVEQHGERSLIWVDGTLRHEIRKSPRFAGEHESVSRDAQPIGEGEARLALQVLQAAGFDDLLYARIDLARDEHDQPLLMELELIEPSLFLEQAPATLEHFASAIARRAARVS